MNNLHKAFLCSCPQMYFQIRFIFKILSKTNKIEYETLRNCFVFTSLIICVSWFDLNNFTKHRTICKVRKLVLNNCRLYWLRENKILPTAPCNCSPSAHHSIRRTKWWTPPDRRRSVKWVPTRNWSPRNWHNDGRTIQLQHRPLESLIQ